MFAVGNQHNVNGPQGDQNPWRLVGKGGKAIPSPTKTRVEASPPISGRNVVLAGEQKWTLSSRTVSNYLTNIRWAIGEVSRYSAELQILAKCQGKDVRPTQAIVEQFEHKLKQCEESLEKRKEEFKNKFKEQLSPPRFLSDQEIHAAAIQTNQTVEEIQEKEKASKKEWEGRKEKATTDLNRSQAHLNAFEERVKVLKEQLNELKEVVAQSKDGNINQIVFGTGLYPDSVALLRDLSFLGTKVVVETEGILQSGHSIIFKNVLDHLSEEFAKVSERLVQFSSQKGETVGQMQEFIKKNEDVEPLSESAIHAVQNRHGVSKHEMQETSYLNECTVESSKINVKVINASWELIADRVKDLCQKMNRFDAIVENNGVEPTIGWGSSLYQFVAGAPTPKYVSPLES